MLSHGFPVNGVHLLTHPRATVVVASVEMIRRVRGFAPPVCGKFTDPLLSTVDLMSDSVPSFGLPTSTIPQPSARAAVSIRVESHSLRVDAFTIPSACLASETTGTERWRRTRRSIHTFEQNLRTRRDVSW